MRGVIESVDSAAGMGTVRSNGGELYAFSFANLVRRSLEPHVSAHVVFCLKNGKIHKLAIGPNRMQTGGASGWWAFWPWEWLVYLP
jgi:hypothetical protein